MTRAAARISGCRNIVPAKRLSEHQLDVPDWGICFELEKEIPENTTYVGVRAHYIDVSTDLAEGKNSSVMQTIVICWSSSSSQNWYWNTAQRRCHCEF